MEEKIIQIIDKRKYSSRIVEQPNAEKNLDGLYKVIAMQLVKEYLQKLSTTSR